MLDYDLGDVVLSESYDLLKDLNVPVAEQIIDLNDQRISSGFRSVQSNNTDFEQELSEYLNRFVSKQIISEVLGKFQSGVDSGAEQIDKLSEHILSQAEISEKAEMVGHLLKNVSGESNLAVAGSNTCRNRAW